MPIGSMPSVSTAPGTALTLPKNFSNHRSSPRPFQSTRSADCAFTISSGVGSYSWISAPGLVMDSTTALVPATFWAMSWRTVNVVRMRLVLEVLVGGRQAGNATSSAARVIRCHHETADRRGRIPERFRRRAPILPPVAGQSERWR